MVASIQYIERIIEQYNQATAANYATPGRLVCEESGQQGTVVWITPELADEVIITGDLHGHRRHFNTIRKIAALDSHPRRHLILQEVCHGGPTYPQNGGCMSHSMLEDVAKLKATFPKQVHFLMGNHELAEITEYPIQKNRQMLNLSFRLGLQQMFGPAADKVREAYVEFLESSPLAVRLPHGEFISHSIPEDADSPGFDKTIFTRPIDPAELYERSSIFDLLWGRDYRPENAVAFAKTVDARVLINGHEPCTAGYAAPNEAQIILDCCGEKGCYVVLPTDQELSHEQIVERIQKLD